MLKLFFFAISKFMSVKCKNYKEILSANITIRLATPWIVIWFMKPNFSWFHLTFAAWKEFVIYLFFVFHDLYSLTSCESIWNKTGVINDPLGVTMDLAEWIIDDTCLVLFCFGRFWNKWKRTDKRLVWKKWSLPAEWIN